MVHTLIPPGGGALPLADLLNRPRHGVVQSAGGDAPAPTSTSPEPDSVIIDLSTGLPGGALVEDQEARALAHDLDRGVRQIAKAVERFLRQIEHLQDQAERVGEQLFRQLTRDLAAGNFDDQTPDEAVSKLLSRFEHFTDKIADFSGNLIDRLGHIIERDSLAGEDQDVSVALSVSQSVSLSIESLQLTIEEGDSTVQVSYQSISISISTSVSFAISQTTPQVLDLDGNLINTDEAGGGLYVDAGAPDAQDLLALLQTLDNDQDLNAQNSFLLFTQISTSVSLSYTQILLDAAIQINDGTGDENGAGEDSEAAGLFDYLV